MENDKITDVSVYIAALQTTFKPAWDARHTTHWFTTDEVYESIKNWIQKPIYRKMISLRL